MGKSAATSENSGEAAPKPAKTEEATTTAAPAPEDGSSPAAPAPKNETEPAAPAPKPAPKPAKPAPKPEPVADTLGLSGDFIINGYEGNKNDWHFVNIKLVDAAKGVY